MHEESSSTTAAHRRLRKLIALLIVVVIPPVSLRFGFDLWAGIILAAGLEFLAIPMVMGLVDEDTRFMRWYAGVAFITTAVIIALGMLSGYNNPY
jgi:hypothetical protein